MSGGHGSVPSRKTTRRRRGNSSRGVWQSITYQFPIPVAPENILSVKVDGISALCYAFSRLHRMLNSTNATVTAENREKQMV